MKRILLAIVALTAVLSLTSNLWLSAFGRYLVVDEKPRRCDAIVILSGETVPRVAKGVELYREGYGHLMIMSGGGRLTSRLTDADLMLMEAVDLGVPREAVLLENKSESTYENAVNVKKIILEHDIKSFLLVTSNYHTRRAKYIFGKVFADTDIEFITVAAPDPKYEASAWWKKHEGQQKALIELASIIIYRVKY
ncbi:MAG: YdcF family protein [Peptococcaceae bacterium]|nr:YdcF family protein [Peptococcaceae bacterium]